MKKQLKSNAKNKNEQKVQTGIKHGEERSVKPHIKSKNSVNYCSPPNKQNLRMLGNNNQNDTDKELKSPNKTTSQFLIGLRSNKSKQAIQEMNINHDEILFQGTSKDGKYKIQSKNYYGQKLQKAAEYEKKINLSAILASEKDKNSKIPHIEPSKCSTKENGIIKAYAVNTHQGISRNYNQDRVSITLNIKKNGIKSQFFAIYDGHGGSNCCDYLKQNLHQFLINHKDFPQDPKKVIRETVIKCQQLFLEKAKKQHLEKKKLDKSGSCAIMTLFVENICYIGNVGDSRALISTEKGKFGFNLSRDHKPTDSHEQERVIKAGGKIYRTEMSKLKEKKEKDQNEVIIGPLRVFPGKLSVSRTIGDIEAKCSQFGGLSGCIICEPQIRKFKLSGREDFIILCCDGVTERMQSVDLIKLSWRLVQAFPHDSVHERARRISDEVIKQSMMRRSSDNLTVIVIWLGEDKERIAYQSV